MTLSPEVLDTIVGVLQKELAEVTIDPKQEYYLNWEHYKPKEYQKLLYRAREEVRAILEEDEDTLDGIERNTTDVADEGYQMIETHKLVFYIISDPSSEGGEKAMSIYETPYFSTKEECVEYASTLSEVPKVAWELFCYAEENPIRCHKQNYLSFSATDYLQETLHIQTWLRTGRDNPNNLIAPEDQSDDDCHFKVSEPKYNINAYVRFEGAKIWLKRNDP